MKKQRAVKQPRVQTSQTNDVVLPALSDTALPGGAVFVTLPTLDELVGFWARNRGHLPYAVTDGGLTDQGTLVRYLQDTQWIFAPTPTALVKAVTRWDAIGITPRWHKWPDGDFEWFSREEDPSEGCWILDNVPLPGNHGSDPMRRFQDWIGEWAHQISEPQLSLPAVEQLMQQQFYESYHYDSGAQGDVHFFGPHQMDEYVLYWTNERDNGDSYYGHENETM